MPAGTGFERKDLVQFVAQPKTNTYSSNICAHTSLQKSDIMIYEVQTAVA